MSVVPRGDFVAMTDDPDDYRPASSWLLQVDPDAQVGLSVIRERIGVGDRIPRHSHDVDEVVLYESGSARAHVDGVDTDVSAGDTVFIPAGAVHGTLNTGSEPVEIRAVFPAREVVIDMVERNPLPGTESDAQRAHRYDFATGDFTVLR